MFDQNEQISENFVLDEEMYQIWDPQGHQDFIDKKIKVMVLEEDQHLPEHCGSIMRQLSTYQHQVYPSQDSFWDKARDCFPKCAMYVKRNKYCQIPKSSQVFPNQGNNKYI